MICTEMRGNRIYTYRDIGMKIMQEQTGIIYDDALDVVETGYTYVETDTPIDDDVSDSEALDIIMGRGTDESTDGN